MNILYFGHSNNCSAPGDRRRLPYWAKARGYNLINHSDWHNERIDLVVLTTSGLSGFSIKQDLAAPLVLDIVDFNYFTDINSLDYLRGIKYYIKGYSKSLKKGTDLLRQIAKESDAIIVSSPEQKSILKSETIFDILDFHQEIPDSSSMIQRKEKGRLFWEGQVHTLGFVVEVMDILGKEGGKLFEGALSFDFVTSGLAGRRDQLLLGHYRRLIRNIALRNNWKVQFLDWNIGNLGYCSERAQACILPLRNPETQNKFRPENRLLISWRLGLPALCSPIPAYTRVLNTIDSKGICQTPIDWVANMNELMSNSVVYANQVLKGREYIKLNHNEELLLKKWDNAIAKLVK